MHASSQPSDQPAPVQREGEIALDLNIDEPTANDSPLPTASTEHDSPTSSTSQEDESSSDASSDEDSHDSDASDEEDDDDDDDDFLRAISGMDADDDDDDGDSSTKPGEVLRTAHELEAPPIAPVDNVTITPDMPLEVAGHIHMIVQDQVIVLSSQPGDQRVLDDGTVLVLEDRSVLGRLFETFGPVAKPMFSVRFASPADIDKQRVVKGKVVYYVPDLSVWALTDQLRQLRGCDASNAFDEEVGEKEMEFSDDEEEARWKKQVKAAKSASRHDRGGPQYEPHDLASPRKRPRQQPYGASGGDLFDYGYDVTSIGRGRGGRHPPMAAAAPAVARPPPQSGPSIDDMFSRYTSPASSTAPTPGVKSEPPSRATQQRPPPRHHQQQQQQQRPHAPTAPTYSPEPAVPAAPVAPIQPTVKHERPARKLEGPPVNAPSLFTNTAPVSHLGRVPAPVGGPAPAAAGFAQLASFTTQLPPRPLTAPSAPAAAAPAAAPSIWSSVTSPPPPPGVPAPTAAAAAAAPAGATDPNLVQLLQTMQAMQAMQSQLVAQLVSLGGTAPAAAAAAPQGGLGDVSALLATMSAPAAATVAPEQAAAAPVPAYHPASMMVQNPPVYTNAWERSGGRVRVMAPGVLGVRSEAEQSGQAGQQQQQQPQGGQGAAGVQGAGSIWRL